VRVRVINRSNKLAGNKSGVYAVLGIPARRQRVRQNVGEKQGHLPKGRKNCVSFAKRNGCNATKNRFCHYSGALPFSQFTHMYCSRFANSPLKTSTRNTLPSTSQSTLLGELGIGFRTALGRLVTNAQSGMYGLPSLRFIKAGWYDTQPHFIQLMEYGLCG